MTLLDNFWMCGRHDPPKFLPRQTPVVAAHPLAPLLEQLPTSLALPVAEFLREASPFVALHRLTDAAELVTRFFAIVALSDVHQQLGGFPQSLQRELGDRLAGPTFGAWRDLAAAALRTIREQGRPCFLRELPDFWGQTWLALLGKNEGDPEHEILPLRNYLAHGGRLPDARAEDFLTQHRSQFLEAVQKLVFLAGYRLVATRNPDEAPLRLRGLPREDWSLPPLAAGEYPEDLPPRRVCLLGENGFLDLFPLHGYDVVMLWREEEQGFRTVDRPSPLVYLRYNRGRDLLEFTALAPEFSFAQEGESFRDAFLSVFTLSRWRQEKQEAEFGKEEAERWRYDFADLIEELTAGLVGRAEQLQEVKAWVQAHRQGGGLLWVGGKPGVGKSAFLAALARQLQGHAELCLVPFFFRTGDTRCSPDHFFQAAILRLGKAFGLAPATDQREPRQVQFARALEALRQKQAQTANPKSVLLLLDGLDEVAGQSAEFVRLPPGLRQPGLLWICAGRPDPPLAEVFGGEGVDRLWPDGELPPLAESSVRTLLEQECGRLRYQLFDRDEPDRAGGYRNGFLDELVRRSEGLPLYVRLVIEDLRAGRLTFRDEGELPKGLPDYFERILDRLKVGDVPQMLTDVLAVLCWAAEPLTEETIRAVLGPLYAYAAGWEGVLHKALRYGHVMLRRAATPEGAWGWTMYHEMFRQHLHRTPTIRVARARTQHHLLEWCQRWQEHRSPYALRQTAEHLLQAERYAVLEALARDETFLRAQVDGLPDDPGAPLRTLRAALAGAAARDDAAGMVTFTLGHARRLLAITQETPLEALRAGSLQRAWRLADLAEGSRLPLWHLLLAWELTDLGRTDDARATRARLLDRQFPRLSGWPGRIGAYLLARVADATPDAFAELRQRLVTDAADWQTLAEELLARHDLGKAIDTFQGMPEGWERSSVLSKVAAAAARAGLPYTALHAGSPAPDRSSQLAYLRALAAVRVERGEWEEALGTGAAIAELPDRVDLQVTVGRAQARAGEADAARRTLAAAREVARGAAAPARQDDLLHRVATAQLETGDLAAALETARSLSGGWQRASLLRELAAAQAGTGDAETARRTFAAAREDARSTSDWWQRGSLLRDLAAAQARAGDAAGALQTAADIANPQDRARAFEQVAAAQARAGDAPGARQTFARALDAVRAPGSPQAADEVLKQIALTQAQVGELAAARDTVQLVSDDGVRDWTLRVLAINLARAGDCAAALEVVPAIRREMEQGMALAVIVQVQADAGDLAAARRTAQTIPASGERAGAWHTLARAEARAGQLAAGWQTIQAIPESRARNRALQDLAGAQAQVGDFAAARHTAAAIPDRSFRFQAFWDVALVQVRAGDAAAARQTFAAALNAPAVAPGVPGQVRALAEVAVVQAGAGQRPAGDPFAAALRLARGISHPEERDGALGETVDVLIRFKDWAGALDVAADMLGEARRGQALRAIAAARAEAGDAEGARQTLALAHDIARGIADGISWDFELWEVAAAQARVGDPAGALQTASGLTMERNRARALAEVAAAQLRAGDAEAARRQFDAALAIAYGIPEQYVLDAAYALRDIAKAQARAGEVAAALRTAQSNPGDSQRDDALGEVVMAQVRAGEWAAALETARAIPTPERCGAALRRYAEAQAQVGELAAALTTARSITYEPERVVALREVAAAQARAGLGEQALRTCDGILLHPEHHLPLVGAALAEAADREHFKRLLPPCAGDLDAAFRMCGLLARLYPEQAGTIAELVQSG
jgi:hypothetical protein